MRKIWSIISISLHAILDSNYGVQVDKFIMNCLLVRSNNSFNARNTYLEKRRSLANKESTLPPYICFPKISDEFWRLPLNCKNNKKTMYLVSDIFPLLKAWYVFVKIPFELVLMRHITFYIQSVLIIFFVLYIPYKWNYLWVKNLVICSNSTTGRILNWLISVLHGKKSMCAVQMIR